MEKYNSRQKGKIFFENDEDINRLCLSIKRLKIYLFRK